MNILIAGVGGQGVVLASKLIAFAAIERGESAHTAETIGMAQRGGCVVSHVRLGEGVSSPLIPRGQADMLIAFEPAEAVRALPYLKKGGRIIVCTSGIKPSTDSLSDASYEPEQMVRYLHTVSDRVTEVDGEEIRLRMKSSRYLNVSLLSAAAQTGEAGFTVGELEAVVRKMTKPEYVQANLEAVNGIKINK